LSFEFASSTQNSELSTGNGGTIARFNHLKGVFGCSGVSLPQVLLFARAAQQAGADAVPSFRMYFL
jgi:hypothetical protein